MNIDPKDLLTVTFTLFAIIDIVGSVPILISLKEKMGGINELKATLVSGALMIVFLYGGEIFLNMLGLDVKSFAVGGSIVIFILGLEMVLGVEFFKSEKNIKAATVVPIAFPLIAGSGTLTTVMSLKANYGPRYFTDCYIDQSCHRIFCIKIPGIYCPVARPGRFDRST